MNWNELTFGHYSMDIILKSVRDIPWQQVRVSMKGTSLEFKHTTLIAWLVKNNYSDQAKIQVTNYVNALRRGGLVKPQ